MKVPILLAFLTAISMACGQILFKIGSASLKQEKLFDIVISFLINPYLISGIALYAATIIIWIYVLKTLPLTIAYPITALSYVIVPMLSYFFANEKISPQTAIGSLLIIGGIAISSISGAKA